LDSAGSQVYRCKAIIRWKCYTWVVDCLLQWILYSLKVLCKKIIETIFQQEFDAVARENHV
jgi:hypothetical protein